MGGQLEGIFLAGSLPHEFIILIVTLFICLWLIIFFSLSYDHWLAYFSATTVTNISRSFYPRDGGRNQQNHVTGTLCIPDAWSRNRKGSAADCWQFDGRYREAAGIADFAPATRCYPLASHSLQQSLKQNLQVVAPVPARPPAPPSRTIATTLCPKKVSPLNILQQPPQTCTDLNEILHTQDDISFCHRRQIS